MKRLFILGCLAMNLMIHGAVKTEVVTYKEGETVLEGFVAYDDALTGPRPGIVVVHQWKGLGEYEIKRALMLADLGYVAFCADIYGKGVRATNPGDAGKLAGQYKTDRALLRKRVQAAVDQIRTLPQVDGKKVGAIGYCFGGTTVLELARSGSEIAGVVSFHGGLSTPTPDDAKNIKARILALHGANDPFVPASEVAGFEKEMTDAGTVDWQLHAYGGAVHSFTDWDATGAMKGAQYNAKADARSWETMKSFFAELFQPPSDPSRQRSVARP